MTHRRTWDDFPPPLRCRLEALLGEPVARTRSCEGGFSPSSAEILLGASGSALFVKAVRDRDNPASRADRKSTRLNTSHVAISYAVFCLKKKKKDVKKNDYKCLIKHETAKN